MRYKGALALGVILCLWSLPARADLIWPTLAVETRLLSIPVIAAGLAVELPFYALGLNLRWSGSLKVDVVVNAVSALIGILAIPLLGGLLSIPIVGPGLWLLSALKIANAAAENIVTWAGSYLAVVLITTLIEAIAARTIFKLAASRRNILALLGANAASVGIAFASLYFLPLEG